MIITLILANEIGSDSDGKKLWQIQNSLVVRISLHYVSCKFDFSKQRILLEPLGLIITQCM